MNILSIDYGQKKIGLATADSEIKIASPYKILQNKGDSFVIEKIKEIIKSENIKEIVVGIPISLKGSKSEQTRIVLNFIQNLKNKVSIPVYNEDERMTSRFADQLLRTIKKKNMQDAVAAMIILESFLEKK